MASPVDTSVKWFRSTMPGAPVLTRAAGSLIALLDAFLVNGWGSQTATSVTVAGGVATALFPTDHAAAKHSVVLVEGVTGSLTALNGEQKVTAVAPNTVKWATAAADGTATGTITVKMAPAGFSKPFSGTNLAAYKSLNVDAHTQFLRINDTTTEYARAVGYENMTGISTGTGLFPTSAQINGGHYWGKNAGPSGALGAPYIFASDGRAFYILPQVAYNYYGEASKSHAPLMFGDLIPASPAGDPYATLLTGGASTNWIIEGGGYVWDYNAPDYCVSIARQSSGVGTAIRPATLCTLYMGAGAPPSLPDPISGAIPLGRLAVRDTTSSWARAYFPGAYYCPASYGEYGLDAHQIVDNLAGRAMISSWSGSQVSSYTDVRLLFLDLTGPWR